MRFPFSIFGFNRGSAPTKGSFQLNPTVSAALSMLDGVYALRRTVDMADILLTFDNARLETVPGSSQRIVPGGGSGPLYLTAWFRPQHAQEQARVDSVPMTALPEGRMSGWSRIVVRRPADAATIAFTGADLLAALRGWPLALSTNGAVSDDPPVKTVSPFEALLSQQPGVGLAQIEAVAATLAQSGKAAAQRFPHVGSLAPSWHKNLLTVRRLFRCTSTCELARLIDRIVSCHHHPTLWRVINLAACGGLKV